MAMEDILLRFNNGAVMTLPLERTGEPIGVEFRLFTPEGSIFVFNLIDRLPTGGLVYQEFEDSPAEIPCQAVIP